MHKLKFEFKRAFGGAIILGQWGARVAVSRSAVQEEG